MASATTGPIGPAEQAEARARWAASGAMALTGRPDGPPLPVAGWPALAVAQVLDAFRRDLAVLADSGGLVPDWDALTAIDERVLGERAAIAGLRRLGPSAPGGRLRVLAAADGWVAPNLARPSDLELLPALTEGAMSAGPELEWETLAAWVRQRSVAQVVERARLLGVPLGGLYPGGADAVPDRPAPGRAPAVSGTWRSSRRPLVVDLSALWAGPLAGHLLHLAGLRVVKVEARSRPDGARRGPPAFFDLLNAGKLMVGLDLPAPDAVAALRRLLAAADVVIDASRPRAMVQLGIDVEGVVSRGTSWVSITGYGRTGPWCNAPAFGDDAAVGAGLVAWEDGVPMPAGDAIADPLTGVRAALAALRAIADQRSHLVEMSLHQVARSVAARPHAPTEDPQPVLAPHARQAMGSAGPLGADTAAVLAALER